jgi:integrase/recombinase XerD
MNDLSLVELCQRIRPELACLGDLGRPLLDVVTVIERVAGSNTATALSEPAFALDVLTAAGGEADAAVVGRVLDFLRQRSDAGPARAITSAPAVTVAEAVQQYEHGAAALLAKGSQQTYRTWTRRLTAKYGDRPPGSITAGDLTDLIAQHVIAKRTAADRRRTGRSAEENAVGAFRHLWAYLVEKGYTTDNIAMRLRKPTRAEPRRRGFTTEEAALLRQLAGTGHDRLLDELTLALPERLGLRRIELCRLRISDIDFTRYTVEVWGKGDKYRTMPIPPALFSLIETYLDGRRPAHLSPEEWQRSDELLLRRPPAGGFPLGRPAGRRRIEDLFTRLQQHAPDVFAGGDLSLHSYRHALGTYADRHHGRAMTRAVLGHTSRRTPTDHYVHIPISQVAEVLAEYEEHLLNWDRAPVIPIETAAEARRAG